MSQITSDSFRQAFEAKTGKNLRPEKTEECNMASTRNAAGMTSQGCFVECVLEHEPRIAASYVISGFSTRTNAPQQSIKEMFEA